MSKNKQNNQNNTNGVPEISLNNISTNNIMPMTESNKNTHTLLNISTITISTEEYNFLHEENKRLQKENTELLNRLMKTDDALKNYESDATIQRNKIAELEGKIDALIEENNRLKEDNKKLREENYNLTIRIKKLEEDNSNLIIRTKKLEEDNYNLIIKTNKLEASEEHTRNCAEHKHNCALIGNIAYAFEYNAKHYILRGRKYYDIDDLPFTFVFSNNLSSEETIRLNIILSKISKTKEELYNFLREMKRSRLEIAHPTTLIDSSIATKDNLKKIVSAYYVPSYNKRIEATNNLIDILDEIKIDKTTDLLEI